MKIIRDEETFGIMMIPLLVQWGIRRCNVEDCTNRPNTILTKPREDISAMGLCEECFQQGNVPGGTNYKLVFDDFDAFKQEEQNEQKEQG